MNKKFITYFAIFLILAAVTMRVARHFGIINLPPNFAPIAGIALFTAMYLPKKQALIIPILAMLVSDFFIGFYTPQIMISVYFSFILMVVLGLYVKQNKNIANIIGASLISSILFFLITNYAVWAFGNLYPQTFSGLMQSYIMAIPFFKYTLLGDLFYVTLLFGSYEMIMFVVKKYQPVISSAVETCLPQAGILFNRDSSASVRMTSKKTEGLCTKLKTIHFLKK